MSNEEDGLIRSDGEFDAPQPPEAYQLKWRLKVGLGQCPHCFKQWCWQSPRGWVCQLPKAFMTQPDLPVKTRKKKARALGPESNARKDRHLQQLQSENAPTEEQENLEESQ